MDAAIRIQVTDDQPPVTSLRIALVHVADNGGGAERSVLTLHQSLLEAGHHSRLFVGTKHLDEPGVIEIKQDRPIPGVLRVTRRLEQKGIQNLYAPWFRNLPQLIGDADVVHLHSLWKVRHGFADLRGIRKISKCYPTLMTLRESWMMTGHCACPIGCQRWTTGCGACPDLQRAPAIEVDYTALNWKRKRRAIQRSDLHVTAISNWLKQQIQISPIFAGKPIHVVHNSVDAKNFRPADKLSARKELGVPADTFVVLLAGQSIEGIHRGVSQQAVVALNQLNDHRIHAMLVGNSADKVAEALNTPSTAVPYRNTAKEMAACYQAADLTIVPSEYETFGRVAAESLYCGTPVLAFATGGLPDIVTPNICGRLVPTGDVQAMATAISELRDNPQELAKYREQCVSHVREKFSTERIANEYVEIYRQLITERSAKPVSTQENASQPTPSLDSASAKKISCIIPAFNSEQWLKRAANSVLDTGYPSLEIVVVDDGSTDQTLRVAQDLEKKFPDQIRVLQHEDRSNHGVSATRNLGLRECTGDWISFLDADDYVFPHRYESAAEILARNPNVDGVHQLAKTQFADEEADRQWWDRSPTFGFAEPIEPSDLLRHLLRGRCWATSAIVFRRSLLERSGLFDENLSIAEDCHLWFRMAAIGTIVSGDLTRPVSAYWRHIDSAYKPSVNQRLKMIHAMTQFLGWLAQSDAGDQPRRVANDAVRQYILKGLADARIEKKRELAWSIAWQGARELPSITLNRTFFGQVARLAVRR